MTPATATPPDEVAQRGTDRARLIVAVLAGGAAATVTALLAPWQLTVLIGWDVAAIVFLAWTWGRIVTLDGDATRMHAQREDTGREASRVLLSIAAVASLAGVITALVLGKHTGGVISGVLTATAVATVIVSWLIIQTLFTVRYADLYYGDEPGGIDFNSPESPDYRDFANVSFTVGMTFQIADTNVTDRRIRRTVTVHGLLSYLFGTVIIGLTINVLAGLFG